MPGVKGSRPGLPTARCRPPDHSTQEDMVQNPPRTIWILAFFFERIKVVVQARQGRRACGVPPDVEGGPALLCLLLLPLGLPCLASSRNGDLGCALGKPLARGETSLTSTAATAEPRLK